MDRNDIYLEALVKTFQSIHNGDSGNDAAWKTLRDILDVQNLEHGTREATCRVNVQAIRGEALNYAVGVAENGSETLFDQFACKTEKEGKHFNPAGDWIQFIGFLSRHEEINNTDMRNYDQHLGQNVLRAFVTSTLGPIVEVPLCLISPE